MRRASAKTRTCRPTKDGSAAAPTGLPGNPNMVFQVDDRYFVGGINEITLSVIYLDRGPTPGRWVYDAVGNPHKSAGLVRKQNSGTWRKAGFLVADARHG